MSAIADADLLLSSSLGFGARLAAEKRGIPWIAVVLQPMMFLSAYDPPVMPGFQRLSGALRELGSVIGPAPTRLALWLLKRAVNTVFGPLHVLRAELGLPPAGQDPHCSRHAGATGVKLTADVSNSRSLDEITELRRIGGRVCTLHLRTRARRALWTEGVNYFLIDPPHPTSMPAGKVEVTEVFSYACPACNLFVPTMHKLKSKPAAERGVRFPAGVIQSQRGLADVSTGLSHGPSSRRRGSDPRCDVQRRVAGRRAGGNRPGQPGHQEPAADHRGCGEVLQGPGRASRPTNSSPTAKSFSVDVKVRAAEGSVRGVRVDRTPTIVVNGKYRLHTESAGGSEAAGRTGEVAGREREQVGGR